MQPSLFTARFKPGDRVIVDWHGRGGHLWRVIDLVDPLPWSTEPAYLLEDDDRHRRTALDSALKLVFAPHAKNGPDCTCPNDAYHDRMAADPEAE